MNKKKQSPSNVKTMTLKEARKRYKEWVDNQIKEERMNKV